VAFAAVQRKGKGTSGASVAIGAGDGWATPTSGNLLVVTANSDATVTITNIGTAWTAGPSVVDGNGTYFWWKISQGTESTITCTPSVSDTICITACEYSGNAASPLDASNSSTIAGTSGTTTTSTSVTTTAAGDLIVAAACLHIGGAGSGTNTAPSWTNSFVNQLTATSGGSTSVDVTTFYAELVAGAAGAYSTSASWTGNAADRQQLIVAFTAAATAASVTPQPLVVTTAPVVTRTRATVLRSTLADPPVLTTPQPLVVSGPSVRPLPGPAYLARSSLADVVTPSTATPQPLVVSGASAQQLPNPAYLGRSSLADVASPSTSVRQPLVASGPTLWPAPIPAYLARSSLLDVAVTPTPTQQPLVVSRQPAFPPTAAVVLRGTLADPPVLTTASPLVVSRPAPPVVVPPPLLARSSPLDLATPQPLVVVAPALKSWPAKATVLRSSLADPVVVTGVATPGPIVVTAPAWKAWAYRPLLLAGRVCDCTTPRPSTGTVARPSTGTLTRPDTGIVREPCC
jgi:hypothetical protein